MRLFQWKDISFQWKVVSLMLLVSALPSLAGVIIVDQLLKDTIALGLNERVGDSLDASTKVYRHYIELRKEAMTLQTRELVMNDAFRSKLQLAEPERSAELKTWLSTWSSTHSSDEQGVARIELRGSSGTDSVLVDVGARYPEQDWRAKPTQLVFKNSEGVEHTIKVTYAVPWSLFRSFQELGAVENMYTHLGARQSALTAGYSNTFLAVTGTILIFTIVLGVLLARATTRRLGVLAQGTVRVSQGDLEVELPVNGEDEIAQLTSAFNAMVIELRQARTRLAYLERISTWQEIARRLAHEIKNPLTPILLAVQQLDRKFDDYASKPERYRRLVSDSMEIVTEEVEELGKLVREFSEFARLPQVEPKPVPVGQYVHELLKHNPQYNDVLSGEGCTDRSTGAVAGIDSTMMRRALVNLLDNACEAVEQAGLSREGSVRIVVERTLLDTVSIVVEDNGPGVPEDNQVRLFDPYFTTKSDGTGLGLAIVRKIIIDHGGDIRVESPVNTEGSGTRMVIELPVLDAVAVD